MFFISPSLLFPASSFPNVVHFVTMISSGCLCPLTDAQPHKFLDNICYITLSILNIVYSSTPIRLSCGFLLGSCESLCCHHGDIFFCSPSFLFDPSPHWFHMSLGVTWAFMLPCITISSPDSIILKYAILKNTF